jgi:hypothetical protein
MIPPLKLIAGTFAPVLFLAGWLYYGLLIKRTPPVKDSTYFKAKEWHIARMRLARAFEQTGLYKALVRLVKKLNAK